MPNNAARSLVERLAIVTAGMPDEQLQEIVDFAERLRERQDMDDHRATAHYSLSRAYGDSEPEYTDADIIRR